MVTALDKTVGEKPTICSLSSLITRLRWSLFHLNTILPTFLNLDYFRLVITICSVAVLSFLLYADDANDNECENGRTLFLIDDDS